MKIGDFDIKTLDDCLDVIEDCVISPMWKELTTEEKTSLVGRLSYILEITEKKVLEG